jgi:transposase
MAALADRLLPDALWQRLQPLLPPRPRERAAARPHRGRPGVHGRDHLHGPYLHPLGAAAVGEFGCGSVTTCWRRFAEWARAGVFERLQEALLDELGEAGGLDWSRVSMDSFSLRAVRGDLTGANPIDRAKRGSKLHRAGEGTGLPLSLLVTAANTPDGVVLRRCWMTSPRFGHRLVGGAAGPTSATPTWPTTIAAAAAT